MKSVFEPGAHLARLFASEEAQLSEAVSTPDELRLRLFLDLS